MHSGQLEIVTPDLKIEPKEPFQLVSNDFYPLVWDSGVLVLHSGYDDPQSGEAVTVRFERAKDRKLSLLIISTPDWRLDATKYVRNLPLPQPNTIDVTIVHHVDGKVSFEIGIDYLILPPADSHTEESKCNRLTLYGGDGRVEYGDIEEISRDFC